MKTRNDGEQSSTGTTPSRPGTQWPTGNVAVPNGDLADHLLSSGRHYANVALAQHLGTEPFWFSQAAISCGVAVEHIAKSLLCATTPVLLAGKLDRDTLLHFAGRGGHATSEAASVFSINANDAVKWAAALRPEVQRVARHASLPLKVRNAAVHLALVDAEMLYAAIGELCRFVEGSLQALGESHEKFWSGNLQTVDLFLAAQQKRVEQSLQVKLAAARDRVSKLTDNLSEESVGLMMTALESRVASSDAEHYEPTECPACQRTARIACTIEESEVDWEYEGEGGHPFVCRDAVPSELECPVCQLRLDIDELDHLGLADYIELEPREAELDEWWEPDEDLWRDR